eukprot:350415-Chlamydomonas_euryale.AAC.2
MVASTASAGAMPWTQPTSCTAPAEPPAAESTARYGRCVTPRLCDSWQQRQGGGSHLCCKAQASAGAPRQGRATAGSNNKRGWGGGGTHVCVAWPK